MTVEIEAIVSESKTVGGPLTWRNWANLAAFALNALFTGLGSAGVFGPDNTELSKKYTLLITPAGFAFSIWGLIFLWEAVFAVAQMLEPFRSLKLVELVTPGWITACVAQSLWSIVFAQEWLVLACVCMFGILAGLYGIAWSTDGENMTWVQYLLLRGCFSLHGGWITAASALNVSVVFDGRKASPQQLLAITVASVGVICVLLTIFALVKRSPDPIVCLVGAWAFNAIRAKLSDPVDLDASDRFNPYTWDRTTLAGLELASLYIVYLFLLLAAVAVARSTLAKPLAQLGCVSGREAEAGV